ncbi:MAG: hypothetical protein HQL26_06905, partial [Candidatus Omnitrophica bacterium]|nr:hypothetical protein [Candidatus Omnitrophota bacterium]
ALSALRVVGAISRSPVTKLSLFWLFVFLSFYFQPLPTPLPAPAPVAPKRTLWESEVSEKTLADVNKNAVKDFMRIAKSAKRIDFDFVNVKSTLNKLGLLHRKQLTHAAELLFCDENSMEVQAAIFAGTDKLTFLDIKSFKGNLFSLRKQAEVYAAGNIKWRA